MQLRKVGNQAIRQLRELSQTQKLEAAASIVACALAFYAIGIATNFFANPIFSMFFFISYETAHNIVTYAAVAVAIALAVTAVAIGLTKKGKTAYQETLDKHVIRTVKTPIETPVRTARAPNINSKITNNPEINIIQQEKQPAEKPIMQPTKQSMTKIPVQPSTNKSATTNQESVINQDTITCSNCKKEVSRPNYIVDYSGLLARLVRLCPYCNQPIDAQIVNPADEELYNKHVPNF
jgi:hypothetical protein